MSALLRARLSAFLAGVAVAGVFGVYQLRGDMAEGQEKLLQQVGCAAASAAQQLALLKRLEAVGSTDVRDSRSWVSHGLFPPPNLRLPSALRIGPRPLPLPPPFPADQAVRLGA